MLAFLNDLWGGDRRLLTEVEDLRARVAELTRRIAESEDASRAKSRFFASASHDLRQPLQALALFVSALDTQVTTPQGLTILDAVKQSLSTMDEMFDSLLDMSRLDAGVLKADVRAFVINDVLERLEVEFLPQAAAKGLRLKVVPSSAVVLSDPALLARILRNFLANAVRYTEHGKILVGCRHQGQNLSILVCDTGLGIAADQRTAIFEEYVQCRQRRSPSGMGLGLAIVQRLAGLLGHGLGLSSVPGRGSVFYVTVPKDIAPALSTDGG